MVVWLASELMFFSGLFAAWFTLRANAEVWPPEGVELETARTAAATAVLLASSITMHLAVAAARQVDRNGAVRWLVATVVLGAVFVTNTLLEYAEAPFSLGDHAYGSIFYLMTGFHALHLVGGLAYLLILAGVIAGRGSRAPAERTVEMGAYYWHFVDVVWVAMFITVYVIQ
ncbi:heme-copper oxidase subunit III [soil metagenome]